MKFPSLERFEQYCVSKRRTYLRQLFERRNPRGFFDLWGAELDLAATALAVGGLTAHQCHLVGRERRWLLLQDLHRVARSVVPEFAPAPPPVLDTLRGALHQVRVARSMLIAGERGVGKEQLAILLHALAGRPGALVRVAAAELGRSDAAPARQLMPERGSVFISDFEALACSAQEDLLTFLNGEARRRDLLFFVATRAEPRELTSRYAIRRDLLVRVSQTQVRLPRLQASSEDALTYAADVIFDLARVPTKSLPAVRDRATTLADRWRKNAGASTPELHDYFSEALSYAMWQERKELAAGALGVEATDRLCRGSFPENFRTLRERVATALHAAGSASRRGDERPEHRSRGVRPTMTRVGGERSETDAAISATEDEMLTRSTREDLLRRYYRALLREEQGNLRRVAARAGRRLRDLQVELARLGVQVEAEVLARSASTS